MIGEDPFMYSVDHDYWRLSLRWERSPILHEQIQNGGI